MYNLILKTSGKELKSKGQSVDECLAKVGLEWHEIKAKGTVEIKSGKNKHEHLFYIKQLRQIFANKLTRLMWAKRLEMLLKEQNG